MKITSLSPPAAAIGLLTAAVFCIATVAQAPQGPPPGGGGMMPRTMPPPKNLQVLPKDLTGNQVHEIMEGWAGSLGVHCDTCHAADPTNIGPNGRPRLKFDDDSKPEKRMARIMYTMTEDMKKNYIAKVAEMDKMGSPVPPLTCGTCHRGHLDPEEFVIPKEEGPHGPPPAGAMPPMQH
ncbi:MAG TPA: c-type cytochrome [Terracidiphilus sp.]|nr:c-type cytochrome [Terracidiphilus sp.]HUX28200.1 c-type cytochrome [Terracidiphilus sp.]